MISISQQKFDSTFHDLELYGQPGKEKIKFVKEQGYLLPHVQGKRSWVIRLIKGFLRIFNCIIRFQFNKLFLDKNKDYKIALKILKFLELHPDLLKGKNFAQIEKSLNNRIKKVDSKAAISLQVQYLQDLANSFQKTMIINHPQPNGLTPQPLPLLPPLPQSHTTSDSKEFIIDPINMTLDSQMHKEFQNKIGGFYEEGAKNIVPVLNQTYEGNLGKVKCGAHALKNALVGVGLMVSSEIDSTWFTQKEVFEDLQKFIYDANHVPEAHRKNQGKADTSIAQIQIAIDALAKCNVATLTSKYLIEFHHVCKKCPHMLSSFNMYNNQFFSTGKLALSSMSNFYEVSTQPGPLVHAFMMGDPSIGPGHWITIIMKKEKDKLPTFFGCNSWYDQKPIVNEIINNLNQAMLNPTDAMEYMYNEQIAPGIKNSVLSFNHDGTLKYEIKAEGKKCTIQSLDINNALEAFDFMKRMKWLDKQTFEKKPFLFTHAFSLSSFAHCMVNSKEPLNCKITEEQRLKFIEMEKKLNIFFGTTYN